jgi:hypothetical protein
LYQFFFFSDLGPEKGFVIEASWKLETGNCLLADVRSVLKPLFPWEKSLWKLTCFSQTLSIEKCNVTTQQIAKQTKPIETKGPRTILSCNFSAGALFPGTFWHWRAPFSSWPVGTGNTSTKPRDHLSPFWGLRGKGNIAKVTQQR